MQGTEVCTLCPVNVTTVTDLTWKFWGPNNSFRLSRVDRETLWRATAQGLSATAFVFGNFCQEEGERFGRGGGASVQDIRGS